MFIYNTQYNYFESSLLKDQGITSGFGTKKTPPIEKIIDAKRYISMNQIHSTTVQIVKVLPDENISMIESTDGMITDLSEVALLLKTADCVPALYYDPIKKVIAVTHQGWRGTIANMAKVAIDTLVSTGCHVENIHIALGPSLQDCCNRLFDQRYTDFKNTYPDWFSDFTRSDSEETYMSLSQLNKLQYHAEGIRTDHIDINTHCTRCESDMFYSYDRQDYDISDSRTRNWSFIMK